MKFFLVTLLAAGVAHSQYAASLLGNVGLTTVAGVEKSGDLGQNAELPIGTNVVGPFEAGFTSMQDNILSALGCETGKGYVAGGIDTDLAQKMVAKDCGVELPRWEGDTHIGLIGSCGGHTKDYHFHEKFSCLYSTTGAHSSQVAKAYDDKFIYGMWEDTDEQVLPLLDACGGHWGPTPDSDEDTYHYHVQTAAPFTIGCFGPNPDNSLVTVEQCRALYSTCDGVLETLSSTDGDVQYDLFCPCYDANGSNTGVDIAPLAVFATEAAAGPGGESVLKEPTSSTSSSGGAYSGGGSDGDKKKGKDKKDKKKGGDSTPFGPSVMKIQDEEDESHEESHEEKKDGKHKDQKDKKDKDKGSNSNPYGASLKLQEEETEPHEEEKDGKHKDKDDKKGSHSNPYGDSEHMKEEKKDDSFNPYGDSDKEKDGKFSEEPTSEPVEEEEENLRVDGSTEGSTEDGMEQMPTASDKMPTSDANPFGKDASGEMGSGEMGSGAFGGASGEMKSGNMPAFGGASGEMGSLNGSGEMPAGVFSGDMAGSAEGSFE